MKWIDVEIGDRIMWISDDTKNRIIADNLNAKSFKVETRNSIEEEFTFKANYKSLEKAKTSVDKGQE